MRPFLKGMASFSLKCDMQKLKIISTILIICLSILPTTFKAVHETEQVGQVSLSSNYEFIAEHKKTIACISALCLGYVATRYLFSQEPKENEPELITLNASQANPQTVFLFAHGVDPRASVATAQANAYIAQNMLPSTCYTFSFHDRIGMLNFGQTRDIALLKRAYDQVRQKHPEAAIVLVGISRGASTILNMLATEHETDWNAVKAVILESPFQSVPALVQHISSSCISFVPYGKAMLTKLVNALPLYDPRGIQTNIVLHQFPAHIPIFMGYSKTDKTVAPADAQYLANTLMQQGNQVTLYAAPTGRHSTLSRDQNYAHAVRQFLVDLQVL